MACALGKEEAVVEASKRFDMWMELDNTTLIETCAKTNDSDSIEHCIEKIIAGKGTLNFDSLNHIIANHVTDTSEKLLGEFQISKAEYNQQVIDNLPIKGKILCKFLINDDRIINPEMVNEVVDKRKEEESEHQKIVFETLSTTINTEIGSKKFIETIEKMLSAPF